MLPGNLEGDQAVMFRYPRPAEELYDVENDRYEAQQSGGEF